MTINIEVRDYNTAERLEEDSNYAYYGNIHYNLRGGNSEIYVKDPDSYGDAYISINDFGWWVGCQHAIKLTWSSGEEVILKPDRDVKIKKDKEAQKKILDYFRTLIANKCKYMPFGEPEIKLELSGAEAEFMDI